MCGFCDMSVLDRRGWILILSSGSTWESPGLWWWACSQQGFSLRHRAWKYLLITGGLWEFSWGFFREKWALRSPLLCIQPIGYSTVLDWKETVSLHFYWHRLQPYLGSLMTGELSQTNYPHLGFFYAVPKSSGLLLTLQFIKNTNRSPFLKSTFEVCCC